MISITEIRQRHQLLKFRSEWNELLSVTPHASYFQSLDWLSVRWSHSPDDEQMLVLLILECGKITGFVPLCVKSRHTPIGDIRTVTYPADGWGSFFGPVGSDPQRTLGQIIPYLHNTVGGFDVMELQTMPVEDDDGTWRHVEPDSEATSLVIEGNPAEESSRVATLDLKSDWETYWDSRRRQKNRRRNVERCERRLAELGEINYVRYRPSGKAAGDCDPCWDLYQSCEDLARGSWQDGLVEGNTLHHDTVRGFLRDQHASAVNAGGLDLNLLFLNDKPVAFVYGYHYRGYVDLMRAGFCPDYAKHAPGNVLWVYLIKDSMQRQDRVLDFGPTCLDYKLFWASRLEPSFLIQSYSTSPRAQALRLARWCKRFRAVASDESNRQSKALAAEAQKITSDSRPVTV